jgi:hypothetical protein
VAMVGEVGAWATWVRTPSGLSGHHELHQDRAVCLPGCMFNLQGSHSPMLYRLWQEGHEKEDRELLWIMAAWLLSGIGDERSMGMQGNRGQRTERESQQRGVEAGMLVPSPPLKPIPPSCRVGRPPPSPDRALVLAERFGVGL